MDETVSGKSSDTSRHFENRNKMALLVDATFLNPDLPDSTSVKLSSTEIGAVARTKQ